jgi:serine/threonine protein kinase
MINLIAVEYHKNNLFHGDIKPENLFLKEINDLQLFSTSDVGSLLYLGENDGQSKFVIT